MTARMREVVVSCEDALNVSLVPVTIRSTVEYTELLPPSG